MRVALIEGGVVVNVATVRDEATLARLRAAGWSRFTVLEVVTDAERPSRIAGLDHVVSRDCEPGATLTERGATADETAVHTAARSAADAGTLATADIRLRGQRVARDLLMRSASSSRGDRVRYFTRSP